MSTFSLDDSGSNSDFESLYYSNSLESSSTTNNSNNNNNSKSTPLSVSVSSSSEISLLENCLQQLVSDLNVSQTSTSSSSSSSSTSSSSSSSSSTSSNDIINILVTGSKCTGKSALCETLTLLLASDENSYDFEYIDVNHFRNQLSEMSLPLSDPIITKIQNKLEDGFVLIEDTQFDIYFEKAFSVIFILIAEDDELEKRLINHGDFHTPYNDFHIMEPYNSVCEKFPYTKENKIFILDNTFKRHLNLNARFIKKWLDEDISSPERYEPKYLDSDGDSHKSDSDDSDANETLIHADGKFMKPYLDEEDTEEMIDSDSDSD